MTVAPACLACAPVSSDEPSSITRISCHEAKAFSWLPTSPVITPSLNAGMTIDVDDFLAKTKNADLIYIDSPNNPTGFQFTRNDIQKIIKNEKKYMAANSPLFNVGNQAR